MARWRENKATYKGGLDNYIQPNSFIELKVSIEEDEKIENNIWGYTIIRKQLKEIKKLLDNENPDTVFTVGGGDDIEIAPLSYMNNKMKGDMTVVFFMPLAISIHQNLHLVKIFTVCY